MKQSVFHNHKSPVMNDNNGIPCKEYHGINGKMPAETDTQFDGRTCDCGKLKFYLEECGCPMNKHDILKSKPNE